MTEDQVEPRATELLQSAIVLARRAGHAIMEIYRQLDPAVEYKPDRSPVTAADLASHRIIEAGLRRLTPDWPVLSEESQQIAFEQRRLWRNFWLVDPLDGTKEFLRRSGQFTVNVALIEGGRPVLGVVYAPGIDRLYYSARGTGAWKIEGERRSQIRVAPPPGVSLRIAMSRSHLSGEEHIERFLNGSQRCEFVSLGSSLKFCLVAEGAADIYPRLGPTMEWDTAAAHCIVEEAGGSVTDLEGKLLVYNKPALQNPGFIARGAQ
jgi:3'(2'), 5'-bisphosphate nucleotidase